MWTPGWASFAAKCTWDRTDRMELFMQLFYRKRVEGQIKEFETKQEKIKEEVRGIVGCRWNCK